MALLSLRELLETMRLPPGRPITLAAFSASFARPRQASPFKDAHRLWEGVNGVLTGSSVEQPFLSRRP